MRKRGREVRGVSGRRGGSRRWPRPLGRAPRLASVLLAREEDDRGGDGDGLGRLGRLVAPGRLRVSGPGRFLSSVFYFYFSSVFFYLICFATVLNLKIIQTMPKTPLKIFMLLNGLFQKHIKCFRVFGNIFYTSYEYSSKCK